MRHLLRVLLSCLTIGTVAVGALAVGAEPSPELTDVTAQVYFSPRGGCTEAIVAEIDRAKKRIRVQAYSFTSVPISKALVAAARRQVEVSVILDKSQRTEKYSGADFIANNEIPVLIDERPAIAHSKVMIIDDATVVTGSFNFTSSAEERNVENLLILRSPALATAYTADWVERQAVSVDYIPRAQR